MCENNMPGPVLSLYCVGAGNQTHAVRLSSEHFFRLSHVVVPNVAFDAIILVLPTIRQQLMNSCSDLSLFSCVLKYNKITIILIVYTIAIKCFTIQSYMIFSFRTLSIETLFYISSHTSSYF